LIQGMNTACSRDEAHDSHGAHCYYHDYYTQAHKRYFSIQTY